MANLIGAQAFAGSTCAVKIEFMENTDPGHHVVAICSSADDMAELSDRFLKPESTKDIGSADSAVMKYYNGRGYRLASEELRNINNLSEVNGSFKRLIFVKP